MAGTSVIHEVGKDGADMDSPEQEGCGEGSRVLCEPTAGT